MNLAMVNEATVLMKESEHPFTDAETEFIVQFAFKSGDRERTKQLVEELMGAKDEVESKQIQQTYNAEYHSKQQWVELMENLLVALERYRLEEEKAIGKLAEFLRVYGFEVTLVEIRKSEEEEGQDRIENAEGNVIKNVVENVAENAEGNAIKNEVENVVEKVIENIVENPVVAEEVG